MSKKYPKHSVSKHATVRIPKEMLRAIEEFLQSEKAKKMGFLHVTDVVTASVRELLQTHGYYPLSNRFEILNHDENGVKLFDMQQRKPIDIYIRPMGIRCILCQTDKCEHIDFILNNDPITQDLVKKRRMEGWKLPEV